MATPQRIERTKVCHVCKKEFSCYTKNCWCSELPKIMPISENGDCLCPQCLKTAIDKKFEEHSFCKMTKALFNWSGGKDSALCLHKVLQEKQYEIASLLTNVSEQYQRISMHGVRVELLHKQADSIGLPLHKILIPEMPTMEDYDTIMANTLKKLKAESIEASIFGDIFLEDLRAYREAKLAEVNMKGVFPLWKIPTKELIKEFLGLGFKTITTCVNDKYLDKSFVGRIIDEDFLRELPANVDPCGENGEFHTFVFEGPLFKEPVRFTKGEVVYKKYSSSKKDSSSNEESPFDNGFWYCDLLNV